MKIALLSRKIIYMTTPIEHNDMLRELFANPPESINGAS
jgi:hypothetical protein